MAKKNPYNQDIRKGSDTYTKVKQSGGNPYDSFGADYNAKTPAKKGWDVVAREEEQAKKSTPAVEPSKKKSLLQKFGSVLSAPGNFIAEKAYAPLRKEQQRAADQAINLEKDGWVNTTPTEASNVKDDINKELRKKVNPKELPIVKPALLAGKTYVDAKVQPAKNRLNQKNSEAIDKAQKQIQADFKSGKLSKDQYAEALRSISKAQQEVGKKTQEISQDVSAKDRALAVADTGLNIASLGQGGLVAKQLAEQGLKTAGKEQLANLAKTGVLNFVQGGTQELASEDPTLKGALKKGVVNAGLGTALDVGLGAGGVAIGKGVKSLSPALSDAEKIAVFNDTIEKSKGALRPLNAEKDKLTRLKAENPNVKQVDEALKNVDKKIQEVEKTAQSADDAVVQAKVKQAVAKEKNAGKEIPYKLNADVVNDKTISADVKYVKPTELKLGSDALGDVDKARVAQYADDIATGKPIEPLVVTKEKGEYFVQDGKHRLIAAQEAGQDVPIVVKTPEVKPKKLRITSTPIKEEVRQTPEIKTSKLASSTNQKAIDAKLTEGFRDLPEYARVNVKDQSNAAMRLLNEDGERARRIAMGTERPPEGLLPESVYVALEDAAIKNGDVQLLRELATSSSLSSEATGMGQRIRMLAERDPDSAVTQMRAVADAKKAAIEKQLKKSYSQAEKETVAKIKSVAKPKVPTRMDWSAFAESLKC